MSKVHINKDYLAKRQLKRGTAGWILLAGLGVSYVISGDFAGWNFGIAHAGWGGFAIAAGLMAIMYFCLVFILRRKLMKSWNVIYVYLQLLSIYYLNFLLTIQTA